MLYSACCYLIHTSYIHRLPILRTMSATKVPINDISTNYLIIDELKLIN